MNDYWNDPPEQYKPPECCDEYMEVDNDGNCKCLTCGKVIRREEGFAEGISQEEINIMFAKDETTNQIKNG